MFVTAIIFALLTGFFAGAFTVVSAALWMDSKRDQKRTQNKKIYNQS